MPDVAAETNDLPPPHRYQSAHLANVTAAMQDVAHPASVGPYQIKSIIGRGGMGIVYLAEQTEPIRRTVALKVIKIGMDTEQVIARFESERQAVALMNHPNVARVLDAGATETGRPYFVMEHVPGEPITTFADGHRLSIRHRLELFIQACHAVEHAHQKAIIHRDLKPSNILVAAHKPDEPGIVKVIDFGLAKAITPQVGEATAMTEAGQLLGTPEYMSPEQADIGTFDIDTRTDVYSLGVVLYELLAGRLPFDAQTLRSGGLTTVQHILREVDPPTPSEGLSQLGEQAQAIAQRRRMPLRALTVLLRGELEWVVLKAIRKDRSERYATATELANDLRRYLDNQPLRAGPTTVMYRARKFLHRNRASVTAAAMVSAALLTGIAGTTWQAIRATRAQSNLTVALDEVRQQKQQVDETNQSLRIAQQDLTDALAEVRRQKGEVDTANAGLVAVNHFLTDDLLQSVDPGVARGQTLTVREALDAAAINVDQRFKDQPAIDASVRHTLALTYDALGASDQALPHAQRALEIRRRIFGDSHVDTVASINALVTVLQSLGKFDEAEPLCLEAVRRVKPLATRHPQLQVTALSDLARLHDARGKRIEAERLLREALAVARSAFGDEHPATLTAINNVASLLITAARPSEAEPLLVELVGTQRRLLGDDHPDTLITSANLARAYQDMNKLEDAEKLQRQAVDGLVRVLGEDHPTTLLQMRNLGSLLEDQEKLDEALPLYRRSLKALRGRLGDDHPDTIATANHLASILMAIGLLEEAAGLNREVLASCRKQLGDDHPFTIMTLNNLGMTLWQMKRYKDAEPLFAEAYQRAPKSELDAAKVAYCMSRWGPSLVALERYNEAEAPLREAYQRLAAQGLQMSEPMVSVLVGLVGVCEKSDRPEEAAQWRATLEAVRAPRQPD